MSKLKECPLCGSKMLRMGGNDITGPYCGIVCSNDKCILRSRANKRYLGHGVTQKIVEKAWNTRPIEDALQSENESLKKLYEYYHCMKCDTDVDPEGQLKDGRNTCFACSYCGKVIFRCNCFDNDKAFMADHLKQCVAYKLSLALAENERLKEFARDVARGQLQMPSEKSYIEHVVYNANKILKENKQ